MKRTSKDQDLVKILKEMESFQEEYPEELLAARRASFLEQVTQSTLPQAVDQVALQDERVVNQLRSLGSVPMEYPSRLLAARRQAFVRRIIWLNFVSQCAAVWLFIRNRILTPISQLRIQDLRKVPPHLLTGLALAAFAGYIYYVYQSPVPQPSHAQHGIVQSGQILTSDTREVKIVCKSGARPPLCLVGEYKKNDPLAYQGNGSARPAVAKDTQPGSGELHRAAYANDGLYGPAASWISNSRNSWLKIDLGKPTEINTVTFGRDRLGKLRGHNPGQFVVSLALSDNVYADGNNSNDFREYQLVFDSDHAGFSGKISGAETVVAQFPAQRARYIKITFENKGTAIDEVEAFLAQNPVARSLQDYTTKEKRSKNSSDSEAAITSHPTLTATFAPVSTATPLPTNTLVPSQTATAVPTATEVPSNTPVPTSTPVPTGTPVPTSVPSDTPIPPPTDTPAPPDTDTPVPADTLVPTETLPASDIADVQTSESSNP